ncbi:MAG: LexA family protein [Limnochordia bacterium]|jgi:hypothetical protein
MDNLQKMTYLIKENPTITARQLATALGYAQEKSVYYWLRKMGYKGLRDFKADVLAQPSGLEKIREGTSPYYIQELPIHGPLGTAYGRVPLVVLEGELSPESFAVTVTTDDYVPLVDADDLLIIDPEARWASGDLVLQAQGADYKLRRLYTTGDGYLLIHPLKEKTYRTVPDRIGILGKVVRLVRRF